MISLSLSLSFSLSLSLKMCDGVVRHDVGGGVEWMQQQ